jgi:hypothetical protein
VIPTIGDGNQQFQPIWHEDFARAVATSVERADVRCAILDVAGTELTSQNDLIVRLQKLTGRTPVQAPLPEMFASFGIRALDAIGVDVPFNDAQMAMLTEGNVIPPGRPNALTDVFGVAPTKLADGLPRLLNEQPEQLPAQGVGVLSRKRFWVDISGGRYDADALFAYVREHFADLLPPMVSVKRGPQGDTRIEEGETLTLEIPFRGQVQVRVAEVMDRRITFLTLAGHPIAGAVRFIVEPRDTAVRFEIQVYDRPASLVDELMLRTVGEWLQRGAWVGLAENVVRASGGSGKVEMSTEELDDHELQVVNEWATTLSAQLSRKATSSGRD